MFRDDRQIAMVGDALTRWMRKGQLFHSSVGLTQLGRKYARRTPPWSTGERLMFKFALSLWNSFEFKGPRTDELLATLDGTRLAMVAALFQELSAPFGSAAVDEWLRRYHPDLRSKSPAEAGVQTSAQEEPVPHA